MKLPVSQLTEGENLFSFQSPKDAWMKDVEKRLAEQGYQLNSGLSLELKITKLEPDFYLQGRLRFELTQTCSRCAEPFKSALTNPFEVAMAHVGRVREKKVSTEDDDLDLIVFEGPEINLEPIVEEQFVLGLPYQALCRENCAGICQRCGKNRNLEKCSCDTAPKDSAFSVLRNLKIR